VVLVLILAGASLVWFTHHQTGDPLTATSQAQKQAQAQQVAAALRKLPTDPQALVASEAQAQVNGRARQAIPPGTRVIPDARSWAPDGVGGGTMLVTITVPKHSQVSYDAIMVSEGGQWKVLATIPVQGTP
jgi:hypothetical protein